jgi:hypothetical protein
VARVRSLAVQLRDVLRDFEPDRWSGADCVALAEELSATAKACTAAAARAAARAVACNARDVEWVARTAGSTPGQARDALATTVALEECPATRDAVRGGEVSLAQAKEIVAAEAVAPGSERELLDVATSSGMAGLREASRKVRLDAVDREELHRRQWTARSVRHWVDGDGMVAGAFRLPPEVGVPFVNRLDVETDRVHRAARKTGSNEAREAHAADAFVAMTRGGAKGHAQRADVVFVCSLDAYRRGHTHGDELCHVIGGGPVPVGVVREAVAGDAFVKAVMMRGVEIHTVAHFGRKMKAELRTALELGPAPAFEGAVCVEPGCDRRHDLERDHHDPVANDGLTSYENLDYRCRPHHWAKTERDRKAGLLSGRRKGRGPP